MYGRVGVGIGVWMVVTSAACGGTSTSTSSGGGSSNIGGASSSSASTASTASSTSNVTSSTSSSSTSASGSSSGAVSGSGCYDVAGSGSAQTCDWYSSTNPDFGCTAGMTMGMCPAAGLAGCCVFVVDPDSLGYKNTTVNCSYDTANADTAMAECEGQQGAWQTTPP